MRAKHRTLSVAATIALLAAASPAFAQVYVGGGGPTVEVNLEALNALPQTGPVKARAVRLRHPKDLRSPGNQVVQYDAELETTVIGGNGQPLAELGAVTRQAKYPAHKTESRVAATTFAPGVTLASLRPPEGDGSTGASPRRRGSRHHHRHRSANPLMAGDAAVQAHRELSSMTADDLNYLQRVCALQPKPPASTLDPAAYEITLPGAAPDASAAYHSSDSEVKARESETHAEDAPDSPPAPATAPPRQQMVLDEPPVAPDTPKVPPAPQHGEEVAPPPRQPSQPEIVASNAPSPGTPPQGDPDAPVESQGHANIPEPGKIVPMQPSGTVVLDRAASVEASRPASPKPIGVPASAPDLSTMPVPAETTTEMPEVQHAPVQAAGLTAPEPVPSPAPDGADPAAVRPPRGADKSTADDELRISYQPGSQGLPSNGTARMDNLAERLQGNPDLRVELRSYASSGSGGSSKARRLSLSRALAVRAYLTTHGVDANRIDIRALGADPTQASADRVDFFLVR